jgi:hypothetical protein
MAAGQDQTADEPCSMDAGGGCTRHIQALREVGARAESRESSKSICVLSIMSGAALSCAEWNCIPHALFPRAQAVFDEPYKDLEAK